MAKTAEYWLKIGKVLNGLIFFRKGKTKFNQISKRMFLHYTMNSAFNFSLNGLHNY